MAEQRQQFTDPALEQALRTVSTEILYPPTPDFAATIRQRIAAPPTRPRPWWLPAPAARRRLTFALALLLLFAVILGALPSVRQGVARRLGLANVAIVNVTAVPTPAPAATALSPSTPIPNAPNTAPPAGTATLAPTPTIAPTATPTTLRGALGVQTTLGGAQSRVPFVITAPTLPELGAPNEVYVQEPPPGGRVSLLYAARADLPAIAGTDVGLLVQEFRGGIQAGIFQKGVPPGSSVEPVTVNAGQGYWIAGGMRAFAYTDANGVFRYEEVRSAGNTLIWEQSGIIYRLESSLPKDAAIRIAASVRQTLPPPTPPTPSGEKSTDG